MHGNLFTRCWNFSCQGQLGRLNLDGRCVGGGGARIFSARKCHQSCSATIQITNVEGYGWVRVDVLGSVNPDPNHNPNRIWARLTKTV